MNTRAMSLVVLVGLILSNEWSHAQQVEEGKFPPPKPPELKWVDLLSGKLEDHWTDMNCSLAASFKLGVDDKGEAVLAGSGRPIGLVRSLRPYENFILEMEWRHLTEAPNARRSGPGGTTGNSGLYVWADPIPPAGNSFTRAVEVQVCNLGNSATYTSHGDLFPIHGATMIADPRFGVSGSRSMPVEFRGSKTGQWNKCRVTCVDGTIQEEVNGALVTAGFRCSPRKGYLCLESEGGPVEFRHVRITELAPSPDLKPDQVSIILPPGVRTTCLFNGLDLSGWRASDGEMSGWKVADRILRCSGAGKASVSHALPVSDFTLLIDWETDKKVGKLAAPPFELDGFPLKGAFASGAIRAEGWNRAEVKVSGGRATISINGTLVREMHVPQVQDKTPPRALRLIDPGKPVDFCNLLWMETRAGDR